ncbi:MAG TPA: hypothetical protein VGM39_15495 [Kofleriaceae bacterium]|jgi:hypothetical protein
MAHVHIPTTNATVRDYYEGQYECGSCGLDVPAVVYAVGHGGAQGHGDASAREAVAIAEYNANSVATRTLLYIPCPKCGKRQPGAIGYRVQVILGGAAISGTLGGILYALMGSHSGDGQVCAGVAAILFAFFYYWWGRPWRGVKKRTSIDMSLATFHPRGDD